MIFISGFWFFIFLNLLHSIPAANLPQQLNGKIIRSLSLWWIKKSFVSILVPAGSRCAHKDGTMGVCKLFKTCKWVKEKNINLRTLVTCTFIGRDPVICCNDIVPTYQQPKTPITQSSGSDGSKIIFQ